MNLFNNTEYELPGTARSTATALGYGRGHADYFKYVSTQTKMKPYSNAATLPALEATQSQTRRTAPGLGYGHLHDDHYKYKSTQIKKENKYQAPAELDLTKVPEGISALGFGPTHRHYFKYTQKGDARTKDYSYDLSRVTKARPIGDYSKQVWPNFRPDPFATPPHAAGTQLRNSFQPSMKMVLGFGDTAAHENPKLLPSSLGFGRKHPNYYNNFRG